MLLLNSLQKDSRLRILSFVSIALLMLAAPSTVAQKHKPKTGAAAEPAEKTSAHAKRDRDPVITQIIKDVSPQDVRQIDEKLISFVTRSTLSVNNPGAATSP